MFRSTDQPTNEHPRNPPALLKYQRTPNFKRWFTVPPAHTPNCRCHDRPAASRGITPLQRPRETPTKLVRPDADFIQAHRRTWTSDLSGSVGSWVDCSGAGDAFRPLYSDNQPTRCSLSKYRRGLSPTVTTTRRRILSDRVGPRNRGPRRRLHSLGAANEANATTYTYPVGFSGIPYRASDYVDWAPRKP